MQYLTSSSGLINYDLAGRIILGVLDLMIHFSRDPRYGRKVTDIVEVCNGELHPVFVYDVEFGAHRRAG